MSGNVSVNPPASSSPFPGGFNPWISNVTEDTSPHVTSERQNQDTTLDPRCQSGASARNSFDLNEGRFSENYGADQQRLQISDPHFDKFPTSATFACWKIRFKTEVCTCLQFPTEAMEWIKEVELVDSVDDLKSSSSIRGTMPNFEVLDARIASALNRVINKDRLPHLRVLPGHWSQRFCRELCRPIYSWSSKWRYSGIRFTVGQNSIINDKDSTWWHLGRIVQIKNARVWETQDSIGIVQYGDSSEESWTWLSQIEDKGKRSIEQNLRMKNFEARNGNYETNAVVKNQTRKQREQRTLGDCWQWKASGQCSEGDNCSFCHDINKRAKMTQSNTSPNSFLQQNERNASRTRSPRGKSSSGRMSRWPCKDYLKGTCNNSFCENWHPSECLFYFPKRDAGLVKSALVRIARLMDEQPSKRSKKNGDKSAAAMLKITRQLGCVFQDMEPPKSSSILRKRSNILKPIRCVKFTKAIARHTKIRDQNPSLGNICPGDPHQRIPNAPKFEDRSQEETEWQERCAREAAWKLAKSVLKLKVKNQAAFFSPSENWCLLASILKLEEREFVVDSRASMHMISKKDSNSAELETLTTWRSPTTVFTANGEVQTHEEAIVYVKELENSWQWKSSRTRQQSYRLESFAMNTDTLTSGSTVKKPHLIKNSIRIQCDTENFVPIVVPGVSTSSSSSVSLSTSMTPSRQEIDHPKSSSSSSTSPPTKSSTVIDCSDHPLATVSSECVERQERRDPYSSEISEKLIIKPTKNPKSKKKWGSRARTDRPVSFRHTGMAARIQRESRAWQSSWTQRLTRQFFSWTIFGAYACEKWRTGCRPWGAEDNGRIGNLLEKTQCERGDISQRKRRIYFSNRRWTNQPPWRRSRPENIHLEIRERPIRGEGHHDFLG